ncbi:MAG: thiamine pyrophosphate-dependent dehydrogenase E1 component subunit alpha, partial [Ruminococcaceae bacterium]|nr:thiamine pyrophosphate-dependent dehydrogenase E1 component subunit alpha [Oscillospiraceae bacterium]
MPKSQYVDPGKVFAAGEIEFKNIPLCQYNKTLAQEKKLYTKDDFLRIYRDMRIIREFETMLNEIKVKSEYNGVKYNNPGPAHLSIGQEASAVGQAYCLDINDFTFGSHRSHGEILAKGLSSINKLDDDELYDIMKEFLDGSILSVVEKKHEKKGDIRDLAIDFLLYGALAEIFARTTGFNRGLGGSMHAFFIPFGIFPNNAIVGGAAPVALGAALYKRANHKQGIVIANSGDGALGRGPVLESLNFSSMDQITKLWGMDGKYSDGGMPILFNVFNNFYGMGGQTQGETMGFGVPARLGAGFNPDQMHAERVNGYDPLAVIDATTRKKELLTSGKGPALLEVTTYRVSGHSPSDSSTYRTQEEIDAWKDACPIAAYRAKMIKGKIATAEEFDAIEEDIIRRVTKICSMAIDDELSPRMDL